VRCVEAATGLHALANRSDCAPLAGFRADALLGYGATAPSSLFARAVRRCRASAAPRRWYSAVNVPCLAGDDDDGALLWAV